MHGRLFFVLIKVILCGESRSRKIVVNSYMMEAFLTDDVTPILFLMRQHISETAGIGRLWETYIATKSK
jgi:hypothetical protein